MIEAIDPGWISRALAVITDPNIAFVLLMVGIYGLIFEFMAPGSYLPGVIGAVSLLILDLDHFKRINDSLGHQVGDKLLSALARRLRNSLGAKGSLARFASNEFARERIAEPWSPTLSRSVSLWKISMFAIP